MVLEGQSMTTIFDIGTIKNGYIIKSKIVPSNGLCLQFVVVAKIKRKM